MSTRDFRCENHRLYRQQKPNLLKMDRTETEQNSSWKLRICTIELVDRICELKHHCKWAGLEANTGSQRNSYGDTSSSFTYLSGRVHCFVILQPTARYCEDRLLITILNG